MVGLPSIVFRQRWLRPGDLLIAMVIHTNPAPFNSLKTLKFNPFVQHNKQQERVDFRRQD